jgi:hypothetical protein
MGDVVVGNDTQQTMGVVDGVDDQIDLNIASSQY